MCFTDSRGLLSNARSPGANATGTPDREKAIELVFGPRYTQYVAPIMEQLDQFIWNINARMTKEIELAHNAVDKSKLVLICCMLIIFVFAVFALFFYLRYVVNR